MSAVLFHSDTQAVAQLVAHARHTDHYAERSKADARELAALERVYLDELTAVIWGHDPHYGSEL